MLHLPEIDEGCRDHANIDGWAKIGGVWAKIASAQRLKKLAKIAKSGKT